MYITRMWKKIFAKQSPDLVESDFFELNHNIPKAVDVERTQKLHGYVPYHSLNSYPTYYETA